MSGSIQYIWEISRMNRKTRTVDRNERTSVSPDAKRRPWVWAIFAPASMPRKPPVLWKKSPTPRQYACCLASSEGASPMPATCASMIEPTIFGLKFPRPQRPMIPALHKVRPSQALRDHLGWPKRTRYEPNFTPRRAPVARAATHFAGSFIRNMAREHARAGSAPAMKSACQGLSPKGRTAKEPMMTLKTPASIVPRVDRDCRSPRAGARASSGTASAMSATDRPNTPPIPNPVTNRYTQKSANPTDSAFSPVLTE